MDNLIALFREQAAVLAAYGQGSTAGRGTGRGLRRKRIQLLTRPRSCALRSRASVDSPKRTCAPTQTITGDLGFDSIMVADVFSGLTRKIPGVTDRPGGVRPGDNDRRRDRHGGRAGAGGHSRGWPRRRRQLPRSSGSASSRRSRRWPTGSPSARRSASTTPTSWSTTASPATPRSSTARR